MLPEEEDRGGGAVKYYYSNAMALIKNKFNELNQF